MKNSKALIVYSQTVVNIYQNLGDYNPMKKNEFIVFDDIIADMEVN